MTPVDTLNAVRRFADKADAAVAKVVVMADELEKSLVGRLFERIPFAGTVFALIDAAGDLASAITAIVDHLDARLAPTAVPSPVGPLTAMLSVPVPKLTAEKGETPEQFAARVAATRLEAAKKYQADATAAAQKAAAERTAA